MKPVLKMVALRLLATFTELFAAKTAPPAVTTLYLKVPKGTLIKALLPLKSILRAIVSLLTVVALMLSINTKFNGPALGAAFTNLIFAKPLSGVAIGSSGTENRVLLDPVSASTTV
jgi:hypothetical protein